MNFQKLICVFANENYKYFAFIFKWAMHIVQYIHKYVHEYM